jgi:hypothetical protein
MNISPWLGSHGVTIQLGMTSSLGSPLQLVVRGALPAGTWHLGRGHTIGG